MAEVLRSASRKRLAVLFGMATVTLPFSVSVRGQADPSQPDHPVIMEPRPDRQETVYRLTDTSCEISWTVYHSQVNQGIVQHQAKCALPLKEQASLLTRILERVRMAEPASWTLQTVYLGRLSSFPGLSERLAIQAKQSPKWDPRTGQPVSGQASPLVVQLANQARLFDEWQGVFQRFDLRIEVASVEQVSVMKAGALPYFKQLQVQGMTAADRVPYDCQLWLAVTKRGGGGAREQKRAR
jgi:hypothetical protein